MYQAGLTSVDDIDNEMQRMRNAKSFPTPAGAVEWEMKRQAYFKEHKKPSPIWQMLDRMSLKEANAIHDQYEADLKSYLESTENLTN